MFDRFARKVFTHSHLRNKSILKIVPSIVCIVVDVGVIINLENLYVQR